MAVPIRAAPGAGAALSDVRRGRPAAAAPSATPPAAAEAASSSCRSREILALVADKWSLLVIYTLGTQGTLRFSEVRRRVPAISQRMLTVTLRNLERDGLLTRAIFPEVPPRVEYTLTPLGATLLEIVTPLIVWADAHVPEIDAARARYDQQLQGAAGAGAV